jgi:hypothetical protein
MAKSREKFWFVSLNVLRDKNKELIEWIKTESELDQRSISSFCIRVLDEYRKQKEKQNENKNNKGDVGKSSS